MNSSIYKVRNKINQKLENHPNAKLNWDVVRSIRKEYKEGLSLSKIAIKYNVKKANIWKVIANYSWIEKGVK